MIFRIFHCTWCNDNFNVTNFLQNFLFPSQGCNFPLEKSRHELIRRDIFGSQHNFCINDSLNQKKKKKKGSIILHTSSVSRQIFPECFSRCFHEREKEREREHVFFNQKPDAVVFLLKVQWSSFINLSDSPFLTATLTFFFLLRIFPRIFSRLSGSPYGISLDASQTSVLVKLSNVKLFVSRGRTARFVGRVLQSCVCFENINTILVLEFFSPSLSLSLSL